MSYTDHDRYYRPRHETCSSRPRDIDSYTARYAQPSSPRERPTTRGSMNSYTSPSYYESYDTREPRRSAAPPRYRERTRKSTWPPSPAVEDEKDAARKEVSSVVGSEDGEPPINTRGTVDQESLLDEIEQPRYHGNEDRRFVFVPGADDSGLNAGHNAFGARRKSVAERGNMPHLNTDIESDPILFTKRVSTPYSYTPQKEKSVPASAGFMLSPEPVTPANTSNPRSTVTGEEREAQKEQNARPPRSIPIHTRHDSYSRQSPQSARDDVFEDETASEGESTAHLRINERKPARYSFVKSESQKEELRTNLKESHSKPEPTRRDSTQRPPTARTAYEQSSSSSKESSYYQSPRSSSSSVNSEKKKSRPTPVDTVYVNSPRTTSRPSSPQHRAPSPKLPARLRESPPGSRPSSRGNAARPSSPLAWSSTGYPPSPRQVSITEADFHATYPPISDRSRPPSRLGRHETIQIPPPRVDVQSPSPVRPNNPLPYPVEDHHADVWMPGEEQYQFDHSTVAPPRQVFIDAPRVASPSVPNSPRQGDGFRERSARPRTPRPEEVPRTRRSRSNSDDSKHGRTASLIDRPLPACPRPKPTDRYDDWYSLPGYHNFDICPSCYDGVFADTPFSSHFSQTRRYERPTERVCDFSSPWMRLAWLLTIKQRRPGLDLLYALADVTDAERPCPEERELSTERMSWYGIADPRDGLHVANFAICAADVKMLEVLFPSVCGYFTRLPPSANYTPEKHTCSLRVSSRRFPRYLDLLVSLDAEAQSTAQRPNMNKFIKLARENAFKGECARNKAFVRKAWHFIPSLPEFTVCEECFEDAIWPAVAANRSALPRLVNKSIQLVPNEDPEIGSSCCLYSPRMRRVWDVSVKEEDIKYLERKVLERKRKEILLAKERRGVLQWLAGLEKGSRGWERAREELRALDREWKEWE